ETKTRLFTPEYCDIAVINADDRFGRALVDMVEADGKVPVTTFAVEGFTDADPSTAMEADWQAVDVRLGATGSTFRIVGPGGMEDRKSTRLNSSHVSISYAVFCLKKKKNNSQVC